MWRMTVIMLVNLSLGACVAFPQQKPEEFGHMEKSIEIGKSTKADVMETLGEPQWEDPRGRSLYYSGKVVGAGACAPLGVLLGIPPCSSAPPVDWWIKIALDDKEVVAFVETRMEEEAEAAIYAMQREIEMEELLGKAEAPEALSAIVAQAEPGRVYELYDLMNRPPYEIPQAIVWLCKAASGGHSKAQSELGFWHRPDVVKYLKPQARASLQSSRVLPDARVAYMWYTLADGNGDDEAISYRNAAAIHMKPEDVAEAEQMARDWKPGDCPSADHRLGPPGDT